jgi:hypothetical protein
MHAHLQGMTCRAGPILALAAVFLSSCASAGPFCRPMEAGSAQLGHTAMCSSLGMTLYAFEYESPPGLTADFLVEVFDGKSREPVETLHCPGLSCPSGPSPEIPGTKGIIFFAIVPLDLESGDPAGRARISMASPGGPPVWKVVHGLCRIEKGTFAYDWDYGTSSSAYDLFEDDWTVLLQFKNWGPDGETITHPGNLRPEDADNLRLRVCARWVPHLSSTGWPEFLRKHPDLKRFWHFEDPGA